jgi:hypothetical protein
MATHDSSNTSPTPQLTPTELSGLARRLNARAESVLLRDQPEQQSDMGTAARLIEELIRVRSGIQRAIDSTTDPVCRNHLRELLGGAPAPSAKPELVSVTSVKALLNRLLDHGRESGDEALYGDIATIGRLVFTLWEIIEGAGIKVPTIEMKPAAEGC